MRDITDCLEALSRSPGLLASMVKDIPPARMAERRCDTCWTILEHVAHLAQVQPMLSKRFERLLGEDIPEFVPFNPATAGDKPDPGGKSAGELIVLMAEERERQLDLLRALPPEAWDRKGRHPEYSDYSLWIVVRHMMLHDYWHMYRIEELWLLKDVGHSH